MTRSHDLSWPQTQQCVVDENLVSGVHLYLWEHDNKLSLLLNYPSHCHTSFSQTVWRNLVKVETASFSVYTPLLSQHLIRFCVCPLSVTLFEGRRERELDSISCQCLPACLTNYSCLYSFFRLRSSVSLCLSLPLFLCLSLPPSLSLSPYIYYIILPSQDSYPWFCTDCSHGRAGPRIDCSAVVLPSTEVGSPWVSVLWLIKISVSVRGFNTQLLCPQTPRPLYKKQT